MNLKIKSLMLLALLSLASNGFADGLLGRQYAGLGYTYGVFADDEADDALGHSDGYTGTFNLPVSDNLDLQPEVSYTEAEGRGVEADNLLLGARANIKMCKESIINPFITAGAFYSDSQIEEDNVELLDDDDIKTELGGGVEFDISDSVLIRPSAVWTNIGGTDEFVLSSIVGGWVSNKIFLGLVPAYETESEDRSVSGVINVALN